MCRCGEACLSSADELGADPSDDPACRAVRENPAEAERQLAEPLEQLEALEDALLALEMDTAEHLQGLLQVRLQSCSWRAGLCR